MAAEPPTAWLLVAPSACPDHLRGRAQPVLLVTVHPHELEHWRTEGPDHHTRLDELEQQLLDLAAQGLTTAAMARQAQVSPRTVQRRLRQLRQRYGAANTSQLLAIVAGGLTAET